MTLPDRPWIRLLVLVLTAGVAGLSGALLAFLLLPATSPPIEPSDRLPVPVRPRPALHLPRVPIVSVPLVEKSALKKIAGGFSVADDALRGAATVLTSDGWLVTDRDIWRALKSPQALLPNGAAAGSSQQAEDPATGLVFFRVDARDLDVVALGESAELPSGSTLFLLSRPKHLTPLTLTSSRTLPRGEAKEAIRRSESVARRLSLAGPLSAADAGAGLVNEQGALVGILLAPTEERPFAARAVPIEAVARALRDIVRLGEIHRPTLGISTLDLSELAARDPGYAKAFGAIVVALDPGGPAAQAGLLVNDRVTALGGDPLDGSRLLSELLESYRIGEKVALTVLREGEEKKFELSVADASK